MTAYIKRAEILQLREEGFGYKEIARYTGLKRDQVRGFLLDQVEWKNLPPSQIRKLFWLKECGFGYKKIARLQGMSRSNVRHYLRPKRKKIVK